MIYLQWAYSQFYTVIVRSHGVSGSGDRRLIFTHDACSLNHLVFYHSSQWAQCCMTRKLPSIWCVWPNVCMCLFICEWCLVLVPGYCWIWRGLSSHYHGWVALEALWWKMDSILNCAYVNVYCLCKHCYSATAKVQHAKANNCYYTLRMTEAVTLTGKKISMQKQRTRMTCLVILFVTYYSSFVLLTVQAVQFSLHYEWQQP